ncbi:hypothetical protein Lal_00010014 [Lupinus albus]|nr:hypothetical protein Lal_00000804 [Lupinus albus]KAF1859430.1 hypothetical protein Lal_00010014 [Lupinus albus]
MVDVIASRDSSGWVIPPYPSYYSNWAHSHLMRVGDSLEFHFYHKLYNLVQVRQNDYDHCTTLEPVEIFNSSPAIIPLKEKGTVPPRSYKELKVSLPRAVHGRHWKRRTRHEIEREKMRGRVRHFPLSSHLRFLLSHRGESPTSSPTSMLDHRLRHCRKETRENSRLTSPSSSHFSFVFSLPPSSHFSPQNP